jgi:hypothetical protein
LRRGTRAPWLDDTRRSFRTPRHDFKRGWQEESRVDPTLIIAEAETDEMIGVLFLHLLAGKAHDDRAVAQRASGREQDHRLADGY